MREIEAYYPKAFLARQGATFAELRARLEDVAEGFKETLSGVGDDTFHERVAEGKWSPAEIADHLVRANELFKRALATPLNGEAVIRMARGRVTDDGRPLSPPEEEPIPGRARDELAADFTQTYAALTEAGRQLSDAGKLSETCLHHSFFGSMTGLECLQLTAWHIRHHEKQLPNFGQ